MGPVSIVAVVARGHEAVADVELSGPSLRGFDAPHGVLSRQDAVVADPVRPVDDAFGGSVHPSAATLSRSKQSADVRNKRSPRSTPLHQRTSVTSVFGSAPGAAARSWSQWSNPTGLLRRFSSAENEPPQPDEVSTSAKVSPERQAASNAALHPGRGGAPGNGSISRQVSASHVSLARQLPLRRTSTPWCPARTRGRGSRTCRRGRRRRTRPGDRATHCRPAPGARTWSPGRRTRCHRCRSRSTAARRRRSPRDVRHP